MCCITFDLYVILKDGPIKQYYSCIIISLMIYISSNRTELANSNIGLLISKLCGHF